MSHAYASDHHAHADLGWSPEDPHGENAHQHGHVVVGWKTQVTILLALLSLTVLTVAFYNLEQWAETAFNIHLPGWVNVIGAMSIATIKATLVCMYFMQLRYDKPLNTFVLLFCLFGVGLFLSLTIIDLAGRNWVNAYKAGEIQRGGTGMSLDAPPENPALSTRLSPRVATSGASLPTARRAAYMAKWLEQRPGKTEIDFWAYFYAHSAHPSRHPEDTENYFAQLGLHRDTDVLPSANRSVPRHGRTDALELNPAPAAAPEGAESHH